MKRFAFSSSVVAAMVVVGVVVLVACGGDDDWAPVAQGADGGTDPNAPTPGTIACGDTQCGAGTPVCCKALDGGASCVAADAGCVGTTTACDEAADCAANERCCSGLGGFGESACKATCGATEVQRCKTNAECGAGAGCATYSCPGGRVIQACAKPTGCN